MSVIACQQIRPMLGQTKSHLMCGGDGHLYVVKFQNNPEGIRVLANEFLATRLASACGLTVPVLETIQVTDYILECTPEIAADFGVAKTKCVSDLHFGSRLVGGLGPGHLWSYLPDNYLLRVSNLMEFAGMLAFDQWSGNADRRQAVFWYLKVGMAPHATFIDNGSCFDSATLCNQANSFSSLVNRDAVYLGIKGWDSFEPWLSRMEDISPQFIWEASLEVPSEWWGTELEAREKLVGTLIARRWRIRKQITALRDSAKNPFPAWTERDFSSLPAGTTKQSPPSAFPWRANRLLVM